MTDRTETVVPAAAALIHAVTKRDAGAVAQLFADPDIDWPAVAVLLADNVGCIHDLRLLPHPGPRRRPCTRCGVVGKRLGDLCHECSLQSPSVLTGGQWVPGPHGIRRWQDAS